MSIVAGGRGGSSGGGGDVDVGDGDAGAPSCLAAFECDCAERRG